MASWGRLSLYRQPVTVRAHDLPTRGHAAQYASLLRPTCWSDLEVQRYPHLPFLDRIWALKDNFSAYDAAYVALAEILQIPLITADQRLANAPGTTAQIEWIA
jgi:predicted nucleic acid-binding protein